jgi:hypothetical protein
MAALAARGIVVNFAHRSGSAVERKQKFARRGKKSTAEAPGGLR